MTRWLLLVHKIPREPSASRVYVWRKLKQLGAVAFRDAAWVLPATPRTQEQFQWLVAEIDELGGEATLFISDLVFPADAEALLEAFDRPVREEYQKILAAIERKKRDVPALARRFQQAQAKDYFACPLGERVRAALLEAREGGEA